MATQGQNAPAHGFTRHGQAVHKRTIDHLPTRTGYQWFNERLATLITQNVGTMLKRHITKVTNADARPGETAEVRNGERA